MTTRAPALFVGHGSPMNAIEDTPSTRGWAKIARAFPKPRAIVAISAHWVTEGVRVMSNARPKTIHDFGRGFPQALFEVEYPAPGDPALARRITELLSPFGAGLDESWGLDHGAWSVLVHMYPGADIPIVQVSLDARRAPEEHYAIARALAPLRDDNVMIRAAGNIVHNLPAFFAPHRSSRGCGTSTISSLRPRPGATTRRCCGMPRVLRPATPRPIGSISFPCSMPSARGERAKRRMCSTSITNQASR
jgi:aromatic ring-opening dioxygenase catalytic subunit (LigB family)